MTVRRVVGESGRSLTEMLGTLAIMGILTIGGIAGFNYAMDKSKANDILDGVNKRAIALSTYTMLGTNISTTTLNAEFSNHIGDFTVALIPDGAGFKLTVSGLTDSVCDKVLDNGLKMASKISLGETTVWEQGEKSDHDCAETDNEIVFAFNASLDGTKTCGYCQHKENNTCVADETCDNGCPGDKPMKNSSGTCYSCDNRLGLSISEEECARCSNRMMMNGKCVKKCSDEELRIDAAVCYPCSSDAALNASASECAKCPDREMTSAGTCALKECPDGKFKGRSDSCYSCNSGSVPASAEECTKCSNRERLVDGYCVELCTEGQFRYDHSCVSCDDTRALSSSARECAKCSNRVRLDIGNTGICAPICTDGQFRGALGECFDCSDSVVRGASETECGKCPEREMAEGGCAKILCGEKEMKVDNGSCISCSFYQGIKLDVTECHKCSDRFMSTSGSCCPCDTSYEYFYATAEECGRCPQRELKGGRCVLK